MVTIPNLPQLAPEAIVTFTISDEYKHVLIVVLVLIVQYIYAMIGAAAPRNRIFNKEWMEQQFGKEHELGFYGGPIQKGGYPDCGSGRYTMEAGYRSWFEFNIAQRIHMNYKDNVDQMICLLLITGLHDPKNTVIIGWVYIVGRLLYQIGYTISPKMRGIGAPFIILTQIFLPLYCIYSLNQLVKTSTTVVVPHHLMTNIDVPTPIANLSPPKIKVSTVESMNFQVVTDVETTYKYITNRKLMLEMFDGAENGKGTVQDSLPNSWTFEKTAANGEKSHIYFMNEVLIKNKQMDKDINFYDAKGILTFTIHSTYILTADKHSTNIQRKLTNFEGPERIAGFLPKSVVKENEIVQMYCKMIKEGKFKLPK